MVTLKKINPEFEKLPLKKLFVFAFSISIIATILGAVSQFFLPPEIPLFYGLPQTSAQLAPSIFIILPSVISMFLIVVNVFVSLRTSDIYLKKTMAFTSIIVIALSIITIYKIFILVNSL